MRVLTLPDEQAVARAAADRLAESVAMRPDLVLGLPTGRTAVPFYDELARRYAGGALDLSRARAFNLDELLLPLGHPATFRTFMERHAWDRAGFDRARCAILDSSPEDPEAECRRYDAALAAAGGLDFALLGVGADGHVAYNLPGEPVAVAHLVTLPDALAETLDVPADYRPLRAMTLGLGALRAARRIVVAATTAEKARAVRAMAAGLPDPRWPCSLLADLADLDLLLTPAAAAELA